MKNFVAQLMSGVNAGIAALTELPVIGPFVGRGLVVITYTGRKSGKTFSLPVGYMRSGTDIVIGVAMPEKKTWWRNFLGAGGPISLRLQGVDRSGHAVTERDNGRVSVRVTLVDAV
ncbi:nitroreductase/quinone reductase family protein [Nocardia sp. NPDC059764]|uniref:nitroreductase/quinone reductase family protein n=1 Tax=Nocardia sp. NPDC059764 TaxID=3346939 RepID=UPI00364F8CED